MQKTPEDRNCLACAFPFWAQLTADEQEMLCRYTRPVHYRKGARVHSPLESCVGILLLRTGQLRAYLLSEDGRDVTLYRPPVRRGGVHPVGVLRDGLGECGSVHRR